MSSERSLVATPQIDGGDMFRFELSDVTGTHHVVADDVQSSLPAGAFASAVAARMSLPENVPWSLHTDEGEFLEDDRPIGEQVPTDTRLWVSPKTHLG